MELAHTSQDIIIHSIKDMGDVRLVCRQVRKLAKEIGFSQVSQEEIYISASELANNIVVHGAQDAQFFIYQFAANGNPGLAIVSSDRGPGIESLELAMRDHNSSAGSMGCGLGAVRRLMDEFDIVSSPLSHASSHASSQANTSLTSLKNVNNVGTVIIARKWLKKPNNSAQFIWGGVSRALPGYEENGDAFFVKETETEIYIAVADGLGHGPEAEIASHKAIALIADNIEMSFEKLFPYLHEMLRGTRGVALAIIRLNKADRIYHHAGVGNIEVRVFPDQSNTPVSRSGVLGSGVLPALRVRAYPWPEAGTLVVHSDGISRRWGAMPDTLYLKKHPLLVSHLLLRDVARENDDATVFVLSESS